MFYDSAFPFVMSVSLVSEDKATMSGQSYTANATMSGQSYTANAYTAVVNAILTRVTYMQLC